ncbi:tyrosine-type recombinase/integrase [Streptomyces violaceus]|uniref:Tyrosine-type recombinase/integrase n=1 Tax=Streptomyces violaceus TaxID=1936 RepID=A0ABY9UPC3_STRVL|nr:tyrosine-type recombinase/integrase [Streptomyces janthinus]WND24132.1 tyrosine-type recombinase/integrase [Streptomyces janthinus]GGS96971.1 integrase [Streptomyces janthinus]
MTGTELDTVVEAELVDDNDRLPAVPAHVDINDTLTDEAAEDLANSGRENTRQTYEDQWKAFARWCAANGRIPGPPTTSKNLASYISHLRRKDAPPGTLRLAITSVRHMNARAGHEDTPDTAAALKIYQDHRYAWAASGKGQRSSAPIDLERLRQMLTVCSPGTLAGQRNRVLLLLGYYIRGRASELAALRISDLEFVSASLVVVHKRVSKNDKSSDGREYEVDDPDTLAALRAWLTSLKEAGQADPSLPLLRSVDMWGNLGPANASGQGLTRQAINNLVKSIAKTAEVDVADAVTAHGLRAGVPTDLGAAEYSAAEIKDITGDWASTEMVERYRKVGLRRAGKRTDEGRRASALSMLRINAAPDGDGRTDQS